MCRSQPKARVSTTTRDLLIAGLSGMSAVEVAADVLKQTKVVVSRNDLTAIKNNRPIIRDKARAFDAYCAAPAIRNGYGSAHHQTRWTSCFRNGAAHEAESGPLRNLIPAKAFKEFALDAFREHTSHPAAAHFVSRTGQWLKPILRHLLRCPMSVRVAIARPAPDFAVAPSARAYTQSLGSMEFLWNLPNTLGLELAVPEAKLEIFTYAWNPDAVKTVAVFQDELVAIGIPEEPEDSEPPSWIRGHPLECDWPCGTAEKYQVDVLLRFHEDFERAYDAAMQYFMTDEQITARDTINGSVCRLAGLRPALAWSREQGFRIHDPELFRGSS